MMNSTKKQEKQRKRIARDTFEFLSAGGEITQLSPNARKGSKDFSTEEDNAIQSLLKRD